MKITLVFILLLPFSLCAQWETTSLPQARNDLNGISIDDQIYFLGGKIEGGLRSDIIDIYNTSTKEWSTIEMPEPAFQYHRSIEVDNKLYIQEDYSRFLTYNLTTDEWSELNTPHSISSLTKMDNFLIVSNSYKFSMYDTNIDTWKTFEFTDRSDNSLVAGNGKIIIAGGSDGSLEMNLVEIFDQQSETWATDTLSIPRDEIQSVYHDNKFYFIGGEADGFDRVERIDILDLETNLWTIDSLSQYRWDFDVTICNDKIYIAGGQTFAFFNQFVSVVDIYDTQEQSWAKTDLLTGRSELTGVCHDNKLYFAGGRSDDNTNRTDILDIYDPDFVSNTTDLTAVELECYPNPTTNALKITTNQKFNNFSIVDIRGVEILNRRFSPRNEYLLDVSKLSQGSYYISTSLSTKKVQFIKL